MSLTPVYDDDGNLFGVQVDAGQGSALPRLQRNNKLVSSFKGSGNVDQFFKDIMSVFEQYPLDLPVVALYSVDTDDDDNVRDPVRFCTLRGCLGVPEDSGLVPRNLDLRDPKKTTLDTWFAQTLHTKHRVVIPRSDLDSAWTRLPGRGYPEPCNTFTALPLVFADVVHGFLFLGLNPRRPFDEDHGHFLEALDRRLMGDLATAISNARAVAKEQIMVEQLTLRTREAADSENRFAMMSKMARCGMCYMSLEADMMWANHRCG